MFLQKDNSSMHAIVPEFIIIAAVDMDGVIGKGGVLPWRLPADLAYFRAVTWGGWVLFGRKTWESIGRLLEKRNIIVLSKSEGKNGAFSEGVYWFADVEHVIEFASSKMISRVYVAGGAQIYRCFMSLASAILITRVLARFRGDVIFPEMGSDWELKQEVFRSRDERNPYPMLFQFWVRKSGGVGNKKGL